MATREKQTLAFNRYLLVQSKKKTRLGVSSERSHLQSYVSFCSRVGVTSLFISNQSPGRGGASAAAGARGESSLRISDADLCRSHQEAGEEPTAPAQSQALPRQPALPIKLRMFPFDATRLSTAPGQSQRCRGNRLIF